MADWYERQDDGEQKERKEKKYVTRKEFYICTVILLVAVFAQSISIKDNIWDAKNNLQNTVQSSENRILHQIDSIPRNIEQGIEDANNPLRESYIEIVGADVKAKTATLRMRAYPKEYTEGMAVTFFLSCDGAEAEKIVAEAGADRVFAAEKTIPFCEMVSASVNLKKGDTETICSMGDMSIQGQVLPYFDGSWSGSRSWTAGQDFITFKGSMIVDVMKPDWVMSQNKGKDWAFRNPTAEIYIDGKQADTMYVRLLSEDEYMYTYEAMTDDGSGESKGIKLHEGETIQFVFRMEDSNGLKYRYVVEEGTYTKDGNYEETGRPVDAIAAGRLTIE